MNTQRSRTECISNCHVTTKAYGSEDLDTLEFTAKGVNWVAFDEPSEPVRALVKVRYRSDPAAATLHALPGGHVRVVFDEQFDTLARSRSDRVNVAVGDNPRYFVIGGASR